MDTNVDHFLERTSQWQEELYALREIALDCQLSEAFKWKQPCYTFHAKNIAILGGFKAYCFISFFKGALLKDDAQCLRKPGENSNASRMLTFTSIQEIQEQEATIKTYIYEAIQIEKAGLKVEPKKIEEFEVPVELQQKFENDPDFKMAFEALTPGRRKAYLLYFAAAKQRKTRISRIDNYEHRILNGFGIHDCVCGRSKRMPNCDGSHKYIEK